MRHENLLTVATKKKSKREITECHTCSMVISEIANHPRYQDDTTVWAKLVYCTVRELPDKILDNKQERN